MKSPLRLSAVLFLISPFFSLPFLLKDIYLRKKDSLLWFALFIGVLSYLYLPSLSQDGAGRYLLYEKFIGLSISDFYHNYLVHRSDYVFYTLIFLAAYTGIKFQLLLFLFAFFNAYVPLYVFKKIVASRNLEFSKYFQLFILIILTYSVTFLFSGVRNNVAFSFVILGFYFALYAQKKYWSILLVVLGVLTHFSAFVYLPLLLLYQRIPYRLLLFLFFSFAVISFVIPSSIVQALFLDIELGSEIYDNKVEAYSSTSYGTSSSTEATIFAKILFTLWFYVSLLYVFLTLERHRNSSSLKAYLIFALPVLLFIAFPGVFNRYLVVMKFFFVLLLIEDSRYWNTKRWRNIFIVLLLIQPLYDVFRLLLPSFVAGYFRLENMTLIQILLQTYTYKDMLP
ncbi:hypothetical protein GFJ94_06600 [Flavobacterium sp. LMO8]|uniref:EpsG family protein n=1 Tax=Flavobacterium sp. LMO8 TaxID=2654244 RepID=UPI0012915BEA|nr:EpsG family protein [Flavobacterium sp. LMO8]MQP24731.1 hypothetical protein [Flavobacterium sp. LMO8]